MNLLTYSQQFDNSAWSKAGLLPITSGGGLLAPDGSMTAYSLVPSTTSASHHLGQPVPTMQQSTIYTDAVYVKPNGYDWCVVLQEGIDGFRRYAYFNVATGAIGNVVLNATPSIVAAENGFYRCSISADTNTGSSNSFIHIVVASANGGDFFAGDGISGIIVWGAQVNEGSGPEVYQKTLGTIINTPFVYSGITLKSSMPTGITLKSSIVN